MTTRLPLLIGSAAALALTLAACDNERGVRITSTHTTDNDAKGVLKVIQTLQCPQTVGSLTRKGSASAEGTVCTYVGRKGAEVSLHLVRLDAKGVDPVLADFEAKLSPDLPRAHAEMAGSTTAKATATATSASGGQASVAAPGVNIQAKGDEASVRLPGISIDSDGENASVRIGGLHIDANDSDGAEKGQVSINAQDGEDMVNIQARNDASEVRARAAGPATRATWVLSQSNAEPGGWRAVGYEARGPAGGPIVVATIRTRDSDRSRAFEDAKDLVALNVGE